MSVLMTLRTKVDPARFEQYAAENSEKLQGIATRGTLAQARHGRRVLT
jgi:hypothetical protein